MSNVLFLGFLLATFSFSNVVSIDTFHYILCESVRHTFPGMID